MSAAASVRASVSEARSRWNVSRWAVFGPTPGSRAKDSISRATGSMSGLDTRGLHPREAQPAGDGGHLLLGELASGAQRIVDRGDHEVLEHVDVVGVDDRGIDGHAHELLLAGDRRTDDAATRRP